MRAGDENGDLAHRLRQRRLRHHRLGQLPDRFAELRFVDPWIPGAEQCAVVADVDEALKILRDSFPYVVVKRLLFGIQVRRRNDRQTHVAASIWSRPGDDRRSTRRWQTN